jgi:hypothetical protein
MVSSSRKTSVLAPINSQFTIGKEREWMVSLMGSMLPLAGIIVVYPCQRDYATNKVQFQRKHHLDRISKGQKVKESGKKRKLGT